MCMHVYTNTDVLAYSLACALYVYEPMPTITHNDFRSRFPTPTLFHIPFPTPFPFPFPHPFFSSTLQVHEILWVSTKQVAA